MSTLSLNAAGVLEGVNYEGIKLVLQFHPPDYVSPELIKEFEQKTGVEITVLEKSWEGNRASVLTDFMGRGSSFDILLFDTPWVAEYANLGILVPLKPYLGPNFNLEDFPELLLEQCSWEGKLFALPYRSGVVLFFYNKRLFDDPRYKTEFEAKYGYPLAPPVLYDQMRDLAEFFTRDTNGDGNIDLWGTSHSNKAGGFIQNDFQPYAYSWGTNWVNEETGKPQFNTPELKEALQFYVNLKKFQPPGAENFTSGESVAQFTNGRVAFIHEYLAYEQTILDPSISKIAAEENIGVALKPMYIRLGTGINGEWIGVYSNSKHKEAAAKFVEWLMMPEQSYRSATLIWNPPVRMSVLRSRKLLTKIPALQYTIPLLEYGYYRDPKTKYYQQYREIFGEALSLAFTGQKNIDEALDEAQKEAMKVFKGE